MNIFSRLKELYHTRQAVYKTLAFIKSYYTIFTIIKTNNAFSFTHVYHYLQQYSDFEETNISKYLNPNINFEIFFSRLNVKIFNLGNRHIWTFLRGYYINDLDLFTYSIMGNSNKFWLVLYDFHNHYLQFIFNTVQNVFNRNEIYLMNNNDDDPYSISEFSKELSFKLVFEHSSVNFRDSIKDILDLLYLNTSTETEIYSTADKNLYLQYLKYTDEL